jgi:thiamine-phosphate pyrophosphorylase
MKRIEGIYLVTEEYAGRSHLEIATLALKAGVSIVQYREKQASGKKMLEDARAIRKITKNFGALFFVNDRLDIALLSGADGVHVGQMDIPPSAIKSFFKERLLVGVSVANVDEALEAEKSGADYVAVSPVFDTATKEDAQAGVGVRVLKEIVHAVKIPVVAIGGIKKENLEQIIKAGASSAAVVSAITRAADPYQAALELVKLYRNLSKESKIESDS